MEKIMKKLFLSSEGDGKLSLTFKAVFIFLLATYLPEGNNNDFILLVDSMAQVISGLVALFGIMRKMVNGRWSVVK